MLLEGSIAKQPCFQTSSQHPSRSFLTLPRMQYIAIVAIGYMGEDWMLVGCLLNESSEYFSENILFKLHQSLLPSSYRTGKRTQKSFPRQEILSHCMKLREWDVPCVLGEGGSSCPHLSSDLCVQDYFNQKLEKAVPKRNRDGL